MPNLALKSNVFDRNINVPNDPVSRSQLGVAALDGLEAGFEAAAKRIGSGSIADVYAALQSQGMDALADRLAANGISRADAAAGLKTLDALVSRAGSYQLLQNNAVEPFYVTPSGDILTHPNQDPPSDPSVKIDNVHQLALALTKLGGDPIADLPADTRTHLLAALDNLKTEVLTVQLPGQSETKASAPNLSIPDNGGWVSDAIEIDASGRLADIKVDLDISHTYVGDLTVELVAPDRSAVQLHARGGGSSDDIKKTYTLDDTQMRALEGKEVNGRWRIRIIDQAGQDVGTLNNWKLDVSTRGSTQSAQTYGEAKKKALYAGAGALGRRLATVGDAATKRAAFDFTADLVKTSPYFDVRSILVSGLNQGKDQLEPADKTRFEKELVPLVAPETPDYDSIFQISYDANGQPQAAKNSLNFVLMCGHEEDDLIHVGSKKMLVEKHGFREATSDKRGYAMFVKDVNQGDADAICKQVKVYVAPMTGRNMFQAADDPDIDVVQYDGHSNLGRNIENSIANAPDMVGSKIFSIGACATTDRSFMIRNRYPNPQSAQLINTYESTYFNYNRDGGPKVMNYSENMMLMTGMMDAMTKLKPWTGTDSIGKALDRATDSWSHTVDINYTNPGRLEQLMLWDLDANGVPDGGQAVWDGGRIKPEEDVRNEFRPKAPSVPVDRLDGTKLFAAVQSLDTFGRYNPITHGGYQVRTLTSNGFSENLGPDDPMVKIAKDRAGAWTFAFNPHFSHASIEAFRAELHHEFINAVMAQSTNRRVRGLDPAERKTMALLFTAASLEYDNGWYDDRVFDALLERHNYPDGIGYRDLSAVLHEEHTRTPHELAGNWRNIAEVKDRIGADVYAKLSDAQVGVS
ncbi:MAG: proprotein convertase P-domain-containing protein [Deltaproteobacteria bacterium]